MVVTRYRDLPDRRRVRVAHQRRPLPRSLVVGFSRHWNARGPRMARLALRLRDSQRAGLARHRHAARDPAPRTGGDSNQYAASFSWGWPADSARQLGGRVAAAVCGLRQDATRATALPRPAALSRRPARAPLRRHGSYSAVPDGRDRPGDSGLDSWSPIRTGAAAAGRTTGASRLPTGRGEGPAHRSISLL